ncbi:aminotransferase class V-fold PLP-dependent enzyme, partial [Staphylococcus aureus]
YFEEVIFTRGTTAAINIVARSYGDANVEEGDEMLRKSSKIFQY